jgi:RHS repeat-associated protein
LKHTNYNSGNKKYYEEDIVQPIGMAVAEAPAELEAFGKKIIQTLPSDGVMYKYKYNGKEWQDELGLNVYALDWRQYDPALGRFSTLDPETDEPEQLDKSPYAFAWNNPVLNNDPDGRNPIKGWLKKALKALADDGVKYAAKTSKGGIKPVSQKSAEKMLKQGRSIIKTPDGSSNKVAKRTMESASGGKKVVRHDGHDLVNAQGENTGDKGLNHFQKKAGDGSHVFYTNSNAIVVGGVATSDGKGEAIAKKAASFGATLTDNVENFGTKIFGNNDFGKFINEINPANFGFSDIFKSADETLNSEKPKK